MIGRIILLDPKLPVDLHRPFEAGDRMLGGTDPDRRYTKMGQMHAFTLAMAKLFGGLQSGLEPGHNRFDPEAKINEGDPNARERIAQGSSNLVMVQARARPLLRALDLAPTRIKLSQSGSHLRSAGVIGVLQIGKDGEIVPSMTLVCFA
jgi:hypothetical protein